MAPHKPPVASKQQAHKARPQNGGPAPPSPQMMAMLAAEKPPAAPVGAPAIPPLNRAVPVPGAPPGAMPPPGGAPPGAMMPPPGAPPGGMPPGAPPGPLPGGGGPPGAMPGGPPGGALGGPPGAGPPGPGPQGPGPGGPPPQGSPSPALGGPMPPSRMPPPPPGMAGFARVASGQPPTGQSRLTPAEMGALGRDGDSLVAHLTPGEIEVPPQVQTPQVMAALRAAFMQAGANPGQFVAGSPQAKVNPQTGMQQFGLGGLGGLLGPVLGIAGSILAPELLPAWGLGAAALGGGLGSAAGTALGGGSGMQDVLAGLGGAAGAGLGGAMGGAGDEGGVGSVIGGGFTPSGQYAGPSLMSLISSPQSIGAGMGAILGSGMAPQPSPQQSSTGNDPNSNNKPMPTLDPQFGALLGSNTTNRPDFTGYDPVQSVMGPNPGYRFYPVVR